MCSSDLLAMAGIDYSHVKEPDYDKSKFKQSVEISEQIKRLSDTIYERWQNREILRENMIDGMDNIQTSKQIYYDTDGILEEQTQNFTMCQKCSGVNTIDSRCDKGYHIYAITIPNDSCPKCVDYGHRLYKNASNTNYSNTYLQDRVNDIFYSK